MSRSTLVLLILVAGALAGCVGSDDAKPQKEEAPTVAEEAVTTAETGSVKGQVITVDLEPVVREVAALIKAGNATPVMTTTTDLQGRFTFNGVPPESYRVHITSTCCVSATKDVIVTAGEVSTVSFQVERLVNVIPYVEENEWSGFIACGAATPVYVLAICSIANDPNDRFLHPFDVAEGLESLVVGMAWDAVGGVSGDKLWLLVEKTTDQDYGYAGPWGVSPLLAHVTDDVIDADHAKFSAITEEGLDMRFRVFARDTVSVVYQQPFTIYWHEYYNVRAPEDANPIPDG